MLVLPQKALPANVEQQLLGLLAQFKEARAAAAVQEAAEGEEEGGGDSAEGGHRQQQQQRGPVHYLKQKPADAEERPPINPLLVVFNAVLNGLVELGCARTMCTCTANVPCVLRCCCRVAAI